MASPSSFSHELYRNYIYVATRGKVKQTKLQVPIDGREADYDEQGLHEMKGLILSAHPNDVVMYNADNVIKTHHSFTLNPLLRSSFFDTLCESDRLLLLEPANAEQLWLLAILEGIEVHNAFLTNNSSVLSNVTHQDASILSDRNVIQSKLEEIYKKKWANDPSMSLLPKRCLISAETNDRIPSLPIFTLGDQALNDFIGTCFESTWFNTQKHQQPSLTSYAKCVKNRNFANTWTFVPTNSTIVPYELLLRDVTQPHLLLEQQAQPQPQESLTSSPNQKMYVLQVTAIMSVESYHLLYGNPKQPHRTPFTYEIGGSNQFYDTFEKFYVYHPSLYSILHQVR